MAQKPKKPTSKERMHIKRTEAQIEARRDAVMHLRVAGASTRAIADLIENDHGKVSHVTIANDINIRLKETIEKSKDGEKLRAMQIARTEKMIQNLWPKALKEPRAARIVLAIMEKQDKYTGNDQPLRIALGGDPAGPPVEVTKPPRNLDLSKLTTAQLTRLREIRDLLKVADQDDGCENGEE